MRILIAECFRGPARAERAHRFEEAVRGAVATLLHREPEAPEFVRVGPSRLAPAFSAPSDLSVPRNAGGGALSHSAEKLACVPTHLQWLRSQVEATRKEAVRRAGRDLQRPCPRLQFRQTNRLFVHTNTWPDWRSMRSQCQVRFCSWRRTQDIVVK